MKERPILFTPENAQKLHDGTKTQTRRIIKPQPVLNEHGYFEWTPRTEGHNGIYTTDSFLNRCPYGVVGDRLWVREACWVYGQWVPRKGMKQWMFQEGNIGKQCIFTKPLETEIRRKGQLGYGWVRRPGIFMPRWACRTVLEITNVRVQRLRQISREDAIAEGVGDQSPMTRFAELWESINGAGSWEANPWVWALTLRRSAG